MTDEVTDAYTGGGLSLIANRRFWRGIVISSRPRNAIIRSIQEASQARGKVLAGEPRAVFCHQKH